MTGIQTFWLEPIGEVALGLRRYTRAAGGACESGYHQALVYIGVAPTERDESGYLARPDDVPHDDARWPARCSQCEYRFVQDDVWQPWSLLLYRRADTGELRVLHDAGPSDAPSAEPGACWDAWWLPFHKGPDGRSLMVRCPDGHDWLVDGRASNCTLPEDGEHRCWVRHGDPRECHLTVDKNGNTCQAGAGSIQTPKWHGFLRDGLLVT